MKSKEDVLWEAHPHPLDPIIESRILLAMDRYAKLVLAEHTKQPGYPIPAVNSKSVSAPFDDL